MDVPMARTPHPSFSRTHRTRTGLALFAGVAALFLLLLGSASKGAAATGPTQDPPSGTASHSAVVTAAEYASASVRGAGGHWPYQRLNLYLPRVHGGGSKLPVLVRINTLSQLEDPTVSDTRFLQAKLPTQERNYGSVFLNRGYAVVRAKIGFGRGQICGGEIGAPIPGHGLFVPPGDVSTLDVYRNLARPMAERDVIMVVQYIREQIAQGSPAWSELDPDRIILEGHSLMATIASWTALGPDRADVTFGPGGPGSDPQERQPTRVWALLNRRGLFWLPGQVPNNNAKYHWPKAGHCDPTIGFDLRGELSSEPIHPPEIAVWASALDFADPSDPPHVFQFYNNPTTAMVDPKIAVQWTFGTESPHSAWDGLAWKARSARFSKIVVTQEVVEGPGHLRTGAWYDEVVPNKDLASEARAAHAWLEDIRLHGRATMVNFGGASAASFGGVTYLPHLWGDWNRGTGAMSLRLSEAPPGETVEVWRTAPAPSVLMLTSTTGTGSTDLEFIDPVQRSSTYQALVLGSSQTCASNQVTVQP